MILQMVKNRWPIGFHGLKLLRCVYKAFFGKLISELNEDFVADFISTCQKNHKLLFSAVIENESG